MVMICMVEPGMIPEMLIRGGEVGRIWTWTGGWVWVYELGRSVGVLVACCQRTMCAVMK